MEAKFKIGEFISGGPEADMTCKYEIVDILPGPDHLSGYYKVKMLKFNNIQYIPISEQDEYILYNPPQPTFKPFQQVISKTENGPWTANYFSHSVLKGSHNIYYCITGKVDYIVPYEGNEHLLGASLSII